jgi:hypothetical protein
MPTSVPTPTAGLLLARANEVLWSEGDPATARGLFEAAYRAAEPRPGRSSNPEEVAEAALGLAGLWAREDRTAAAAVVVDDRLHRALATVPSDGLSALRLRTRIAAEADHRDGGRHRIVRALAEARAGGDPVAMAEALRLAHQCLLDPAFQAQRLMLAEELVAMSARTKRRGDLLVGLPLRTVGLLSDGDLRADRALAELRAVLHGRDHVAVRQALHAIDVMALIRAGRFAAAERMAGSLTEKPANTDSRRSRARSGTSSRS